jgi:hypothetical protein
LPCPIVTNQDIIDVGGLNNLSNYSEFFSFVKKILEKRYLDNEDTPSGIRSKARSFIENDGIKDNMRHSLIWANMHEELQIGFAHSLAKMLTTHKCRPLVITCANGLTMCVEDDSALELNPEIFPPTIYASVSIIDGPVSVFNDSLNGRKKSCFGTPNTVRYLVGRPHDQPKQPFEVSYIVPPLTVIKGINGTNSCIDFGSDDTSYHPLSMVAIVQTRKVKQLSGSLDLQRCCSFSELRVTSPGRWSFMSVLPSAGQSENLKKLLCGKHVFYHPMSIITRSTRLGGRAIKDKPSLVLQERHPRALGIFSQILLW